MDNDIRAKLEHRRQRLQVKIKAETHIERYIQPVQEIFDYLRRQNVAHQIAGFVYIPAEYHLYIEQTLTQAPYNAYGFQPDHLQNPSIEKLIDRVFDRFPSINQFRYVPDLPEYANYNGSQPKNGLRDGLKHVTQALDLQDQPVYVYYLNYGIVLQLSLATLSSHEHEDLFNTWHGEVMIFADHTDWLIAFTLEEEWLAGFVGGEK